MIHAGMASNLKLFGPSLVRPLTCFGLHIRKATGFSISLAFGCKLRSKIAQNRMLAVYVGLSDASKPQDLYLSMRTRCFSKDNAPTTSNQVTSRLPDQDLLLNNLTSADSTSEVLKIVEAHISIMNCKHLLQALRSLFEIKKSNYTSSNSNLSKEEIIRSPEFLALCKALKSQTRAIELNDTIQALKIVNYLGVPSSSALTQGLLQIIRHSVNDLSLQQIVFLDFLLKRLERCAMVDALKLALPLVFEVQLSTKLDRTHISHLAEMLQYATRKSLSTKSVEMIVESLTTLTDRGEVIDMRTAKSIVWSLCDYRKAVDVQVLLRRATTTLANAIEQCSFHDIENILEKLVRRIIKKHMEFYHEDFMDRCGSYIIKKDSGFEHGTWILRKLTRIGHTSIDLLNYLGEKVVANPAVLCHCKPHILFTLVTGFSNADYKPANWQVISNVILNHWILEEGKVELPWLKFAVELAALGCFSSSLLERIFERDFLEQFLAREYNLLDNLQLLLLHQAVVTLYPTYMGPFPPEDILEKAVECNGEHIEDFPLEAALAKGLGGPAYVQTKLYTRLGHCIDHVIVLRKGGFPIALSPAALGDISRVLIEDLEIPADSQIVTVIGLHPGCYSINCSRLRGNACLMLRTLEALNLSVVSVSLEQWKNLPDHEKIPFLMQAIKIKCNTSEPVSVLQ